MSEFKTTEAAWHLENNQTQMDEGGAMVGVSRQAIDEVLIELTVLRMQDAQHKAEMQAQLLKQREACVLKFKQYIRDTPAEEWDFEEIVDAILSATINKSGVEK